MNERIRELAKEAGVLADYGEDIKEGRYSIGGSYQSMEKFAELIVAECILTIQMGITRDGHNTEKYLRSMKHLKDIKKHFGVEE